LTPLPFKGLTPTLHISYIREAQLLHR